MVVEIVLSFPPPLGLEELLVLDFNGDGEPRDRMYYFRFEKKHNNSSIVIRIGPSFQSQSIKTPGGGGLPNPIKCVIFLRFSIPTMLS